MKFSASSICVLVLSLFMTGIFIGCVALQTDYETPSVSVSSFEAVPGEGVLPQFEIGLHIINPNRTALELRGVAYTVSIEGHKLLTGVSNDLPVIEPYGTGDVLLQGSVDGLSSISFFTYLIRSKNKDNFSYSLDAKLDAGTLYPIIRVNKKGKIALNPSR